MGSSTLPYKPEHIPTLIKFLFHLFCKSAEEDSEDSSKIKLCNVMPEKHSMVARNTLILFSYGEYEN
jgi:hypothetical protein